MPSRSFILASAPIAVAAVFAVASLAACSSSSPAGSGDSGAHDARAPSDGAADGSSRDAAKADAGMGLTCGHLLTCDHACTSTACTNACYANATGTAQGIFDALNACIAATCGSDAGEACADGGSATCAPCQSGAATGACVATLMTCFADLTVAPPDPDGGSAGFDGGAKKDAAPALSCGELTSCEAACGDAGASCDSACVGESTPTAQALSNALEHCLAGACPAGDGGSCDTAGTTCTACRTQAEFDPTLCGTPFSACEADTSNRPDAGSGPVALQGGTVVTLASGLDQPQVVIVQNGRVYYSQITSTGAVSDVELTDASAGPTTLSASQPFPMGLALDPTNIYVWNSGTFSGSTTINERNGTVVQVPLAGGATITLATGLEVAYAAPYVNAIAVNAGQVYWVAGASGNDGVIMSTAVGSAVPVALYSGQLFPEALVTDGTNLYWANWGTFDAQGNYNNDGTVVQAPIHAGTVVTLATGLSAPAALAVDSKNVYWTNTGKLGADNIPALGSGSVMQAPIGGGTVITLAKSQAVPIGIATGNRTVYWNDYTLSAPGTIESVPVGGGSLVPLVGGLANPFGITVSGSTLVWSDSPPTRSGSGKILALTLP